MTIASPKAPPAPRSELSAHEVVLVRPWDVQHTGSGCCGRVGGHDDSHLLADAAPFQEVRADMERMGAVYRALKEHFGEGVRVQVVDPRNIAWLLPTLVKRGYEQAGAWGAARALSQGFAHRAVILDGEVLFQGAIPEPEEAVAAVAEGLGRRGRPS